MKHLAKMSVLSLLLMSSTAIAQERTVGGVSSQNAEQTLAAKTLSELVKAAMNHIAPILGCMERGMLYDRGSGGCKPNFEVTTSSVNINGNGRVSGNLTVIGQIIAPEISDLQFRVDDLEGDVSNILNVALPDIRSDISALETDNMNQWTEIRALQSDLTSLENDVTALRADMISRINILDSQLTSKINNLESSINTKIASINSTLNSLDNRIDSTNTNLSNKYNELKNLINNLTTKVNNQVGTLSANHFCMANNGSTLDCSGNQIYHNGGRIGIGTGSPSQKLHVNGNAIANAYYHNSDRRLKKNIKTSEGLAIIMELEGVTYELKAGDVPSAGVIAQDVEKVFPRAVAKDDKGMLSVEYDQLIAPLIESVKELNMRVEGLEAENAELKEKLDE